MKGILTNLLSNIFSNNIFPELVELVEKIDNNNVMIAVIKTLLKDNIIKKGQTTKLFMLLLESDFGDCFSSTICCQKHSSTTTLSCQRQVPNWMPIYL